MPTNNLGSNDFRFYLDLNRNGKFEDSGPQPQVDSAGLFIHSDGTADSSSLVNVLTNFMVGDPQWIGVLERPDAPHGPNNKFLARYAFVAVPADGALDINFIHNQRNNHRAPNDGYFRNQGIGSWEINLAAFLADLNTNQWGQSVGGVFPNTTYYYYQYQPYNNQGSAFMTPGVCWHIATTTVRCRGFPQFCQIIPILWHGSRLTYSHLDRQCPAPAGSPLTFPI